MRARRLPASHPVTFALIAGGLLGWSAITRPLTAIAIGTPFAILALTDLIRYRGKVVSRYLGMTIAFVVILSILPLFNFIAAGSPFANTYRMWWSYDSIGFGPQFGSVGDGHWYEDVRLNTQIALKEFGTLFLGWPVLAGWQLAWIPVLLGLVWRPYTKRDWGLMVPPVLLAMAHTTYWAASTARYYSEGMPFLWILAARGLIKFGATTWTRRLVKLALPIVITWSILSVINPKFEQDRGLYGITRHDANAVAAAGLHNALVFVHGDYWTMYANLSWLNQPILKNNSVILAEDRGPAENSRVIADYPGRPVYYYNRELDSPLFVYAPSLPEP
jgi:hypothetical protein